MEIFKSNRYGDAVVLEYLENSKVKVKFLNSGHEDIFHITSLRRGEFRDKSISLSRPPRKIRNIGDVISSNNFGDMVVLKFLKNRKCIVQFINTGTTVEVYTDNAYAGKVKDRYARTCYGHGYLGEFKRLPYWKQALQLWRNMLKRCYCEKDPKGYFGKHDTPVIVSERWLCFADFLKDLPSLPNFDKWLLGHKEGNTKYNLDKDLKVEGNRVYCKELCQFVTKHDNKSAGAVNARRLDKLKN